MFKSIAIVIVFALLIFGGYAFISNPDRIVITESGRVEGLLNKARALLQRDRFWHLQLKMATEEYDKVTAPRLPSSAEMQELYKKLREAQAALDEKMKPLYTLEEQEANRLRIKADSLERTGKWRVIDDAAEAERAKESERIKIIIPVIEAKLHIVKP
jgi:hypothetical protein